MNLLNIPQGNGQFERELRQIYLKGFKLAWLYANNANFNQFFHIAIVRSRDGTAPVGNDFLRTYTSARNLTLNTTLEGPDGMKPINTDLYDVLYHSKWYVGATLSPTKHDEVFDDVYIPINRYVNYDGPLGSDSTDKIYCVCWSVKSTRVVSDMGVDNGRLWIKCYVQWEDTE